MVCWSGDREAESWRKKDWEKLCGIATGTVLSSRWLDKKRSAGHLSFAVRTLENIFRGRNPHHLPRIILRSLTDSVGGPGEVWGVGASISFQSTLKSPILRRADCLPRAASPVGPRVLEDNADGTLLPGNTWDKLLADLRDRGPWQRPVNCRSAATPTSSSLPFAKSLPSPHL